ncbi:type II toxin-antitoxin system VapC family toxin [Halochromatium glycolicum]|jgi:predicted nucleic acid-binding protein|uniref:Ribonuclease VapC n=1 Tax=Halochromatium glycolicum TaxID=85075 RepID=A0AAJ0U3M3_9GAMM|nr:PIN domain-containing protein [Halochromatium glycolicum]MBK1704627.1 PIN domain nuclease [Halochromatium glycolicum]
MPEPVFIDTGYILALVNEADQHHAEALAFSERFDGQPVVVTDAVLLEIGNALSRIDRGAAVEIIRDLRESPEVTLVPLTPELFDAAFDLYRSHADKRWGLVDCISFVVMRRMGLSTALAFDQHFVQAGFLVPQR